MLFARCKTCMLWFNSGIDEGEKGKGGKVRLSCPLGHSNDYSLDELREKSRFEKRVKRVAGRPVSG